RPLLPAILRRAAGVPLFLVSFAEDARQHHGAEVDVELPWTLAQIIRQRVVELPEAVREVLGVAAVVGRQVWPALLVEPTGKSEEALLRMLEAAADARLLQQDALGDYHFRHDLIREAIEQDLSLSRRRLLHRRIGEALASLPNRNREKHLAEIAWHFLRGERPERAVQWILRDADRAVAMFASGEAEMLYQRAAELGRELDDAAAQAEALEKLGEVRYRFGRYGEAVEPLEEASAIYARLGGRDRSLSLVARAAET